MCLCEIPFKMRAGTLAFTALWSVGDATLALISRLLKYMLIYYRVLLKLSDIVINIMNNVLERQKWSG